MSTSTWFRLLGMGSGILWLLNGLMGLLARVLANPSTEARTLDTVWSCYFLIGFIGFNLWALLLDDKD